MLTTREHGHLHNMKTKKVSIPGQGTEHTTVKMVYYKIIESVNQILITHLLQYFLVLHPPQAFRSVSLTFLVQALLPHLAGSSELVKA